MTSDHQCCSGVPDWASKMFEERDEFLIKKFETLINCKLVEVESKTGVLVTKMLEEQQDSLINKIDTLIESKNLHKAETKIAVIVDSTTIALEHDDTAVDHETGSGFEVTHSPNQSSSDNLAILPRLWLNFRS